MGERIKITAGETTVFAEFNDSETSRAILKALPIESRAMLWGKEIYFDVPLRLPPEGATDDVEAGDAAYWPSGPALCLFFGPTPMSTSEKPVPASAVNPVGKLVGDPAVLRDVGPGASVRVEKA